MTATMDQQLEEVLAGLGEQQRREVLDFARSLRREEEDDEEEKAFMQMLECMHAAVHRLRLVIEGDVPDHIVVIRSPSSARYYSDAAPRRAGFRPRGDRA
jgi:hypothetical protein